MSAHSVAECTLLQLSAQVVCWSVQFAWNSKHHAQSMTGNASQLYRHGMSLPLPCSYEPFTSVLSPGVGNSYSKQSWLLSRNKRINFIEVETWTSMHRYQHACKGELAGRTQEVPLVLQLLPVHLSCLHWRNLIYWCTPPGSKLLNAANTDPLSKQTSFRKSVAVSKPNFSLQWVACLDYKYLSYDLHITEV